MGLAGIVAAAVRESRLDPGLPSSATQRRRALIASAFTLAFTALLFYGGYKWWNVEAAIYAADIYHPLSLSPMLSGNTLELKIGRYDTDALHSFRARSNSDLLPDHGHVMHLYAIRQPAWTPSSTSTLRWSPPAISA